MALYISDIHLKNIRCFKDLSLRLVQNGKPVLWTTLLGENAAGKTTLLRSIAIGLCDESSAAGLLKESEQGYIRRGASQGTIMIELRGADDNKIKCSIETTIKKENIKGKSFENLRQEIRPTKFRPWDNLLICAYGIGRGSAGTGDISGYTAISAVYNLFNYSEGLQNPELVWHRLKTESKRKEIRNLLKSILNLTEENNIHLESDGIKVEGPWDSKMPLRDLADGYRSTFQWVTDFIGWAISFNPIYSKSKSIQGIVLIDAIEEHLHPRWQRTIVSQLKRIFPNVQFIAATHSPLVAAGTADYKQAHIVALELKERNEVEGELILNNELRGMRADQVLRSHAFRMMATASPNSVSDLTKYYELSSKKKLSLKDKETVKKLKENIKKEISFGDTSFEVEVEEAVLSTLKKMLKKRPPEIYRLEAKRQLRNIFRKKHNERD